MAEPVKRCRCCGVAKPLSKFYRHRKHKDGRAGICAECDRSEHRRKYDPKKHKTYQRRQRLKRYGLTPAKHMALYVEQDGCCAICRDALPYHKVHTDHDHETGKTRGLLCHRCNLMVGYIETSGELLAVAKQYIEEYK